MSKYENFAAEHAPRTGKRLAPLVLSSASSTGHLLWQPGHPRQNFLPTLVVLTYWIKQASEMSKVYVAVVQLRLRNVQKSLIHEQSCSFAILNLLLSCCCKNSLLLCSRNFATIVRWCHTSPLYTVKPGNSFLCYVNYSIVIIFIILYCSNINLEKIFICLCIT